MIDEQLKQIATAGLLGAFLVLALLALAWLFNRYTKEVEARRADNEAAADARLADAVAASDARIADHREMSKLSERYMEALLKLQEFTKTADERSARLLATFDQFKEREHDREIRETERDQRDRERDQRDRERDLRTTGAHRTLGGPNR